MESNSAPNISLLQDSIAKQPALIGYDTKRIDYAVTESELDALSRSGNNFWKDVFFISIATGVPSVLNIVIYIYNNLEKGITVEILLNSILIALSIGIGFLSFYAWKKNGNDFEAIMKKIKNKEMHQLEVKTKDA